RQVTTSLTVFFDKYSKEVNKAEQTDNYQRLTGSYNIDSLDDDDEFQDKQVTFEDIQESLKTLKSKYIYEYLRESINQLKKTFYGKELIVLEKGVYKIYYQKFDISK